MRNDGGDRNNSVLVKTIGVKSNRDGIGARVKVVSGGLTQVDEVRSGGSYLSQNDFRLHFGLEKRTTVDLIEVRWPSGVVDTATGIGVNKAVTFKEGKGLVEQKGFAVIKKSTAYTLTLKAFANSSPGLRFGNPGITHAILRKTQP
jgi:hypothetical protein